VSVVPVVIISACGLLSLAFYGRLAAVVSRLRGFQREILKEQEKPRRPGGWGQARRLELLRKQTEEVRQRARRIRLGLIFLTAVAVLIVCSLTLMLSGFAPVAAFFAAGLFGLGLLSVLGGIIAAMLELRGALHPVELETQFVSDAVDAGIAEALHEGGAVEAEEHEALGGVKCRGYIGKECGVLASRLTFEVA
jgi:hypothetical protein